MLRKLSRRLGVQTLISYQQFQSMLVLHCKMLLPTDSLHFSKQYIFVEIYSNRILRNSVARSLKIRSPATMWFISS